MDQGRHFFLNKVKKHTLNFGCRVADDGIPGISFVYDICCFALLLQVFRGFVFYKAIAHSMILIYL